MKIGIFDDDSVTLNVIKGSIDWKSFGITEIFTANDIIQGKRIIENENPSLIISDIEMPMGTGLDLLKWLRESEYSTEVILLTCHEDFNFAKIALQYKALSYILKPFNPEELERELQNALRKIDNDQKNLSLGKLGSLWKENISIIETGFWRDLLFKKIRSEMNVIRKEIDEHCLDINWNEYFRLILITSDISEVNNPETQIKEYSVTKFIARNMKISTDKLIAFYLNNSFSILIVLENRTSDTLYQSCTNLCFNFNENLDMKLTCYIGDSCTITDLPDKRVKLENISNNNVSFKGRTLNEHDLENIVIQDKNFINVNEISLMLKEKKINELLKYCKTVVDDLNRRRLLDQSRLSIIQQSILQTVYTYLYSYGIHASDIFTEIEYHKLQERALHSVFELQKWITITYNKTINYVIEFHKSQTVVEKIKNYIEKNYSKPLTRNEVAEQFYLTPEYLAKLFKKEEGISIKNYINNVRLEKAKQLLSETNLMISEVALDIGFENFSYFATLFKKYTGVTPQNYQTEHNKY